MYGLGLLVAPLIATAIASHAPERWAVYYSFPLGVGVLNVVLVLVAFFPIRDLMGNKFKRASVSRSGGAGEAAIGDISASQDRESLPRLAQVKEEMIETIKLKSVWLISLFFFFYLGASMTIGGMLSLDGHLHHHGSHMLMCPLFQAGP